jgi:hypothetical protein
MDSEIGIYWGGLAQQVQEGLQSGAVGVGGIKLDSGGKHSRLTDAFKAFSLAVSCLSCSISFSISFVLSLLRSPALLTRKISLSSCFFRCSCCIFRCS